MREPLLADSTVLQVRHGYTIHDLDQMTRAAVIADRSMAVDIDTRKGIAWSAIAEYLVACEEPPTRLELIRAGWQAIYREVRTMHRGRGYPDEAWQGDQAAFRPRFALYWDEFRVTPSPETRIVEGIAARQVLAPLGDLYRDAVVALAVTEDYDKAAEMLGISYKALVFRVGAARRTVHALWHEGETPAASRRTDRRVGTRNAELATHCRVGHEWTPDNTYVRNRILRGKRHTSRVCKACERDRSLERASARRQAVDGHA